MNAAKEPSAEQNGCKPFGGAHVGRALSAYRNAIEDWHRTIPETSEDDAGWERMNKARVEYYATLRAMPNAVITDGSERSGETFGG